MLLDRAGIYRLRTTRPLPLLALILQLPLRFEPELQVTIARLARLLPELVGACAHLAAPHHAAELSLQFFGKTSETLAGGFVPDERGRSRGEFDLVLYLFLLVHRRHCRGKGMLSEPVLFGD